MPTYKGFSTIGQRKKFGLTDFDLIKRDLLNAILTRSGEVPGRPDLGTNLWNFVFEPMVDQVRDAIEVEVRNIIDTDARLEIDQLDISTGENTVIIEVAVRIRPKMDAEKLYIIFNQDIENATIIS